MKGHQIVIGCGTGRSGTQSLSRILDRCRGFQCTHEAKPLLTWKVDDALYEQKKRIFLSASGNVGDVHSAYLPYLERFIYDIPTIKIICTRRDSQEVAESFERHIANGIEPMRNHWYEHNGREGWKPDPEWDPAFPKYTIKDRREAILRYADDYNKTMDTLHTRHPQNTLIIMTEELGTLSGQNKMFKFIGIKPWNRRFTRKRNSFFNASRA